MKKFRYYATALLLAGNLVLTSCSSEVKNKEVPKEPSVAESIVTASEEIISSAEQAILNQQEREREEQAAFEKAVSNPDFIDTPEFALVNRVTITWNDVRNTYIVECSSENATYLVNLPEERLISYMLKRCNCEYLYFHNLKNSTILEELSSLEKVKELSLYDTKIKDLDILRKYTSLEGVRLENCSNVRSVSFFEDLPNIVAVEIIGTRVSDISPLSNAIDLQSANLRCNEITNPESLSELENLSVIRLEYNKIENESQLKSFVDKGLMSQELATSIIETSTNHALIFSTNEEDKAVSLTITYYEAQKEYFAEAKDSEGNTIAFLFTDEPYNFYDISKKLGEQKYLCIRNFPSEGYIHHLSNGDDFETVEVKNCSFENFYMPDNVVYLSIYNCPNLTGEFKAFGMPGMYSDLKYIGIRNTGITSISGLDLARHLENVYFEDNQIENYDFLLDIKKLKTATITIDNPSMDKTIIDTLRDNGVEVTALDGVVTEDNDVEETKHEEMVPMGQQRAR